MPTAPRRSTSRSAAEQVYLVIDLKGNPTRVDALLDGNVATVTIPSEVADLCTNWTTWRIVLVD
jgi:hypothetical protein